MRLSSAPPLILCKMILLFLEISTIDFGLFPHVFLENLLNSIGDLSPNVLRGNCPLYDSLSI